MRVNYIKNGDCVKLMQELPDGMIDLIVTSPFYNTNKKAGKNRTLKNTTVKEGQYNYVRYDIHTDNMTDDEYADWTEKLFNNFDRILAKRGCILYNLSYGAENTECMFKAINSIITRTPFTVVDIICWKKKSAFPNSCSSNRLTRIVEYIFVICRKTETKSFKCNKRVKSVRSTGQKMYENVFNFIEAKNNDENCPYNKATYSIELVESLLKMYAPLDCGKDCVVLDPFNGTGTTGVACKRLGLSYIGFELSKAQCKWSVNRIKNANIGE